MPLVHVVAVAVALAPAVGPAACVAACVAVVAVVAVVGVVGVVGVVVVVAAAAGAVAVAVGVVVVVVAAVAASGFVAVTCCCCCCYCCCSSSVAAVASLFALHLATMLNVSLPWIPLQAPFQGLVFITSSRLFEQISCDYPTTPSSTFPRTKNRFQTPKMGWERELKLPLEKNWADFLMCFFGIAVLHPITHNVITCSSIRDCSCRGGDLSSFLLSASFQIISGWMFLVAFHLNG